MSLYCALHTSPDESSAPRVAAMRMESRAALELCWAVGPGGIASAWHVAEPIPASRGLRCDRPVDATSPAGEPRMAFYRAVRSARSCRAIHACRGSVTQGGPR
jgi:hypothetical protein